MELIEPFNHLRSPDVMCIRCKMVIMTFIPHECDPSICYGCDGRGTQWKRGWITCTDCGGNGKTKWNEENPEGVLVT